MLWEEMEKYTKLTGEDATHVPIMKIGAYLDGYEKGTEVLDKIRAEITDLADSDAYRDYQQGFNFGLWRAVQIIDKYMAEKEAQEVEE